MQSPTTPSPGEPIPHQHGRSPVSHPPTRPIEAIRRKRERDRECQRRKRQRDREHTKRLEEALQELRAQLGAAEPSQNNKATSGRLTAEGPVYPKTLRPTNHAFLGPSPRPEPSGQTDESQDPTLSDTVVVSLPVLEACLAAPKWYRLPLHGLSHLPNSTRCVRGRGLTPYIHRMRADATTMERLCPLDPKVIDILYGNSKNPLANMIVDGCSTEPLLPPEKLVMHLTLYKYCRVSECGLFWAGKSVVTAQRAASF